MRFVRAMATLKPQKYVIARTVWTETILLGSGRLVYIFVWKKPVLALKRHLLMIFALSMFPELPQKQPLSIFKRRGVFSLRSRKFCFSWKSVIVYFRMELSDKVVKGIILFRPHIFNGGGKNHDL